MKKIITLLILSAGFVQAQEASIPLDSCIKWAKQNYPLIKQNNLLSENSANNLRSINENWYPKMSFLARATYQTEVVAFNLPGTNYNFPHDAYLSNVSLEQTLYDGGQTAQQKKIERLNADFEIQKNEVELYKLIERVSQLYVNILLTRENLKILNTYKSDLNNKRKNLAASLVNGLALQSNLDELDAESLKTDQSIIEATENLNGLYEALKTFIAKPLNDNSVLTLLPVGGIAKQVNIARPEMKMLTIQQELLGSRYQLTNKMALPKVAMNVGANYGRPGPNFINQNLRFFGDASLSLKWNISSLYGLSKEKTKYNLNNQMIDLQRELFLFNVKNTMISQEAQIRALEEMISKDKQIIEKRHNVTVTAATQLENGKITVTDYLTQLNAEMQATLNQKIHEVKLMNAMTSYNTTRGVNQF